MGNALDIDIGESGLLAVSIRKPSEQMIKAAILHHHHNYVIDERPGRVREGIELVTELLAEKVRIGVQKCSPGSA